MNDRDGFGHLPASTNSSRLTPNNAAALQGASLAFGKKIPVKSASPLNTYSGSNGALAAAARAGRISRSESSTNILSPQSTGNLTGRLTAQSTGQSDVQSYEQPQLELGAVSRGLGQLGRSQNSLQLQYISGTPKNRPRSQQRSPSHIAATLAASRSKASSPGSIKKSPSTSKSGISPGIMGRSLESKRLEAPQHSPRMAGNSGEVDATSIPPTTSLIGMFEQSGGQSSRQNVPKLPGPIAVGKASPPIIHSPKPVRKLPLRPLQSSPSPQSRPIAKPIPITKPKIQPKPPRLIGSGGSDDDSDNDSFVSASDQMSISNKSMPSLPPPRRSRQSPRAVNVLSKSERDAITINAMADAIVASSLASSRAGSPAKQSLEDHPPVPPPRRGQNHSLFHIHHHHNDNKGRTPSPSKGMRQTMRKPPKSDDEDDANMDRARRRNPLKKHPNKHHEGDRKRWRDVITERERKRYEAVWASNKGMYAPPETKGKSQTSNQVMTHFSGSSTLSLSNIRQPDMADVVVNLVVRDIWSRSRLGDDILEEVWDLVDRSHKGYLAREEFVIGMWLIDQRLKGRKLPVRVEGSVWVSVGLGGLKVRSKHDHKKKRDH